MAPWRGPLGALGFPTSNVEILYGNEEKTVVVGKSSHFEHGAIFWNAAAGDAWEVMAGLPDPITGVIPDDSILQRYEHFGGPLGWLGFPTSGQGYRDISGVTFNDFEHGVVAELGGLVYHFGDLNVHFRTIHGDDRDGVFGTAGHVDIYCKVTMIVNGFTISQRFPASGDYGHSGHTFDNDPEPLRSPLGDANSALTVHVEIKIWDADDGLFGNDADELGTLTDDYSIDNLWGAQASDQHHHNHADAAFSVEPTHDFDARDFRGQLWWSFHNFDTPLLSFNQFAATFADVDGSAEFLFLHPFNALFYTQWYAKIAKGGNCFGMSLESIFTQVNHSAYAEPIHDYFPDTQNGSDLGPSDLKHRALMNELNIKHGYQLGASTAHWFLALWTLGYTHDPKAVFEGARIAFLARDYPLISLIESGINSGRRHTVRPFQFEKIDASCLNIASTKCWLIHVADPDLPIVSNFGEGATIQIDPDTNRFHFADSAQKHEFNGDSNSGSRMFFLPFNLYTGPQLTFFSLSEPDTNHYIIADDNGSFSQVSDDDGRTLYKDDYTGAYANLDDLREADDPNRIPEVMQVPTSDGPGTSSIEVYIARPAAETTYHYDLRPVPGVAAGTPVEATFQSRLLSSHFSIPATPGKPDRISALAMGTANKTMALTIASDSEPKTVDWTIAGPDKQRWRKYTVPMVPGQTMKFHLADGGKQIEYDNDGPETIAGVSIHNAAGTPPIDLGPVTIPHGTSTTQFSLPVTTLSLSDEVSGNAGWLTAPPTVTLTAKDLGGTGIAAIQYGPDGVNWTTYTGPFPYTTEGESRLYFRARDNANNLELPKSQDFKLDTRRPATTGSVNTTAGVKLTYAVTDPTPGSGVASVHVLQGATASLYTPASGTVTLSGTCSAVELWGEDVAGNLTTPHVKIADAVPPAFTTVPPATITTTLCTVAAGLNLGTAAATDDCGAVTVTSNAPAKFPLGTTIVTWTARDAAGNTATRTTTVTTDLGDDVSCCPTGTNIIRGTSNNDVLNGTSGSDCIFGLGAQDVIRGNGGNDYISGGSGNDDMWGGDGNDWVAGGPGQDSLRGEAGNDTVSGGDGDDLCSGGDGDDRLMGGSGQDNLKGEAGNDTLEGGAGFDTLNGGTGNDFLRGGTEQDTLIGGGGTDQCVQDGGDVLTSCPAVAP